MDRFNPFLHTEQDQFNPLTLTNLHYLQVLDLIVALDIDIDLDLNQLICVFRSNSPLNMTSRSRYSSSGTTSTPLDCLCPATTVETQNTPVVAVGDTLQVSISGTIN